MTDSQSISEVTGTSSQSLHTETSPLKKNEVKKSWLSIFWSSDNENDQGSLKTITLNFLIFTVIITLGLLAQVYYGGFQIEPHGSVASDSFKCSEIGVDILKKGGSAVDAAVAATICLGVVNFHVTGLGGGGHLIVYNHKKRSVLDVIDFYPTVPNSLGTKPLDMSIEGLRVGVPGMLMGLWEAHQKFGKLHWKDIVMPAANLAKYGFKVPESVILSKNYLNNQSRYNKNLINFLNSLKEGQNTTFPELGNTLELIATSGIQGFYSGKIAMDIIYSVKEANGSMILNDLVQYKTSHGNLLHTRFSNFDILASGSSSGGSLLLNALDTIQSLDLDSEDNTSSTVLKLSDVLHDSYISYLEKNNAGPVRAEPAASHVSAVDVNEYYVSIVTGLNTYLGSQLLTGAGFILNNAIINGGINNERRPISLSTPVIALETDEICGKRLILGSGDVTIAAQVLTNALALKNNASLSIESPRFFIDNIPRHIRVEDSHKPFYKQSTLKRLQQLLKIDRFPLPYKSINAIEKIEDTIISHSDTRGGGLSLQF